MKKLSRFHLLGIFLATVTFTVRLLILVSIPIAPDTLTVTPASAAYNVIAPSPTPFRLESQCALTGEHYELRVGAWQTTPTTLPYATYPSPDGRYVFYKEGDDLFVRDRQGQSRRLGSDVPYSDIVGRVFWSPNSRSIIMTPGINNQPTLFDITSEATVTAALVGLPPLDFKGWSPDGEHFLYGNGDGLSVSIGSVTAGVSLFSTQPGFHQYSWSPDGHWLAYTWEDSSNDSSGYLNGLTLVAADGSVSYNHPFYARGIYSFATGYYPSVDLNWSPDSRFLALNTLVKADQIYQRLMVFGTDGKTLSGTSIPTTVAGTVDPERSWIDVPLPPSRWTNDGHELMYIRQLSSDQFELRAYRPEDDKSRMIDHNLVKPWFESPSRRYLGFYARSNGLYTIRITNPNGENPVTLVENATDAGNPDWSPDEKWVAAVWAEGKGSTRKVHLTWMHPDGSERHNVDDLFKDVRELRWLNGGAQLAYIAWRGVEGNSIEMVDVQSGERTVLAEGFESVTNPEYEAENDSLSFWWKTDESNFGKDAYHSDGTQVYHVLAAGDFDRPRVEFWSPDGKVLALKMPAYWGQADQMLVLDYKDGRAPVVIRAGLDGLGDPFWSPDSRMVAFTQWVRGDPGVPNPVGLAVVSADGKTLWYEEHSANGIDWFPCNA